MADAGSEHSTWVTAIDDPYLPMYYATLTCGSSSARASTNAGSRQRGPDGERGTSCAAGAPSATRSRAPTAVSCSWRRGALPHVLEAAPAPRPRGQRPQAHPTPRGLRRGDLERIAWFRTVTTPGCSTPWTRSCRTGPGDVRALPDAGGRCGEVGPDAAARQYGDYENSIGTGQGPPLVRRTGRRISRPHRTPEDPDFVRQMGGPDPPAPAEDRGIMHRAAPDPAGRLPVRSSVTATPSSLATDARSPWTTPSTCPRPSRQDRRGAPELRQPHRGVR